MRGIRLRRIGKLLLFTLAVELALLAPASGQQVPSTSAEHEAKATPVVRTFGAQGGYRTEVKSETHGILSQDDRRQVSVLAAQLFQHVDEARKAIDSDATERTRQEVGKGREVIKAILAMLPKITIHTRTTSPDGKVIYEDERQVQDDRIPLYEGMVQARTLAPIQAAQRDASRVAGVRVIESEAISTEVVADLEYVEAQLNKAAKALDNKKAEDAANALLMAQIRGVDFRYRKEDKPLAEARDAIWLAKRALEEDNSVQAQANLEIARQRLELYRQVLPEDRQGDVKQMMSEVGQLEKQLQQEKNRPTSGAERSRQGRTMSGWWDRVNEWFNWRF